jgi:ABC-type antimicrobial peptide transport system permease subunit
MSDTAQYWNLALRLDPHRIASVMKSVQALHEQIFPESIYESHFYDDEVVSYYREQATIANLFEIFAALAIFISCLGLYGLVSFMAAQKTKEVGIRKVLGASVGSIVYLFSREFTLLVAGAFLVSAPMGWYFMNHWLEGFYYHTDLSWVVFVIALLASVLIAWATVGYRSIRAALADPVKALKYE